MVSFLPSQGWSLPYIDKLFLGFKAFLSLQIEDAFHEGNF